MERAPKAVEQVGNKADMMAAEKGLAGPSLKDFSVIKTAETALEAEKELTNILETFGYDYLEPEAKRSMLESLLTEAETIWKLDPVEGNKYRFIVEAVAKELNEENALAKYLDAVDLPADTKISFH